MSGIWGWSGSSCAAHKDVLLVRWSSHCSFEHSQSPVAHKCQCTCGSVCAVRFTPADSIKYSGRKSTVQSNTHHLHHHHHHHHVTLYAFCLGSYKYLLLWKQRIILKNLVTLTLFSGTNMNTKCLRDILKASMYIWDQIRLLQIRSGPGSSSYPTLWQLQRYRSDQDPLLCTYRLLSWFSVGSSQSVMWT